MKIIIKSIKVFLILTVITGVVYPLTTTIIGQILFKEKANGSLVYLEGKLVGSKLIGQKFESDRYFVGRPSFTNYDSLSTGASNKALSNNAYKDEILDRYNLLTKKFNTKEIPQELFTASGSGLDPHISKKAALIQVDSICKARGYDEKTKLELINLVNKFTEGRDMNILGEERINVLLLNIALDKLALSI